MRTLSKHLMLIICSIAPLATFAQQAAPDWMQETLFRSGKMMTVVLCVAVILVGLAIWMWRLDRRIGRMEKDLKKGVH